MFFGHEEKIRNFKNLVKNGKLGQSYLFFGDRGIGKAIFAGQLGYLLEFGKFEIGPETPIDMRIFSPNENNVIGVAEALNIRHFLWETPLRSERRLAVIDGAETLTPEAQGAMLKIVEEPPSKSLLIFVTYDAEALFPPLLSRLTKIYFSRFSSEAIGEILRKYYQVPAEKAKRLGAESFGSLGRALSLLTNVQEGGEKDLKKEIEAEILALRRSNIRKNTRKIGVLLEKLTLLRRYNLNQNLARKAISYALQKLS